MKRLITIILLAIGLQVSGQVNWTPGVGAWQLKDTTGGKNVRFRSNTGVITPVITQPSLSDSLSNYTKKKDGLISGGSATIGTGSVTIDTAYYRLRDTLRMSLPRTFTGILNSPAGTQYYLVVYGNASGLLDTISGTRDTIAVIPNNPANTVKINTVLVGDGGIESASPDLSAYALSNGSNAHGDWNINSNRWNGQFYDREGGLKTFFTHVMTYDINTNLWGKTDKSLIDGGGSSYTFTYPLSETGGVVSISNASTSTTGALTSTDWNLFNAKESALTFSSPLVRTGNNITLPLETRYIQNGTGLQASSNFYISGTGRATNFGAGISPNANARYVAAAGTSTIGQFLWTPSASYAGTENGMMNYNSGDSTLRMMRFGSSDQVIFNNNNPAFKLSGLPRLVEANSSGGLAATKPIVSILVTDSDIITAITGASYTSDRATITPASSKVMLTGQIYDDGTYTYIAIANNVVRRW